MSDNSNGNWCLIESDPGVFTEMIKGLGVIGVQVEELYSLDDSSFNDMHPVYGLIFLFKWRPGAVTSGKVTNDTNGLFFAQQVITNACATQSIINLLLNIKDENVVLGSILEDFKNFTVSFDPANRGLCLSNSEPIRQIHNSFGKQTFFELDTPHTEKEEAYHYVTFIPYNGHVYELDGLKDGPIDHGSYDMAKGWLPEVIECLKKKIETYSKGEINFSLMAVVGDKLEKLEKELASLKAAQKKDEYSVEIKELERNIRFELDKREKIRKENIRRKHNYIPFLMELLKALGKDNKLIPLIEHEMRKQDPSF
ncbi:Ubiquitin carboxyl-terminal hydrolase isozyme L5 [Strongyloides ratti]|uniref:Ubiquitin carboxyl-terminal hydrolase n=1 Tax=Strongyloides ratti TaxID=34506 RepID=A0A090LHQ9_STRRB|nr:Ubiquitin carboxyl-terminal hydrolase isozyme L5 [Strongyloides ratti]CEF69341.1 Ubiquitin carboxyl-terminal hydrolase isozyme L5 [Strongyloides ratti]